jgi:hypothetical protein
MLALTLFAFIYVRVQEHLLRHRAERLLSDYQSIHLNQTSWAEAQAIMRRWGGWGYATGPCTAIDCFYTIDISDAPDRWLSDLSETRLRSAGVAFNWLYWILGGGHTELLAHFTVQDGTAVQSSIHLIAILPNSRFLPDGIPLFLAADSRASLGPRYRERGKYDQMAIHPDYIVGRPDACTVCQAITITYTPHLEPAEIARLTSFDLSCLTRYHACTKLTDFLPAATPWHLWNDKPVILSESEAAAFQLPPTALPAASTSPTSRMSPPHPCNISPIILGRDARVALEVEVISTAKKTDTSTPYPSFPYEVSEVRLTRILKNASHESVSPTLQLDPFPGAEEHLPEHLVPGRRYVLLLDPGPLTSGEPVYLNWCGALEDTPENLAELQTGFAEDKPTRHPEHDQDTF